jgi:hypothetical protein
MIVQALSGVNGQVALGQAVSLRCPSCRQIGTFDRVGQFDAQTLGGRAYLTGLRLCPNHSCRALIFIIWDVVASKLAASYPPERLDFDPTNIPASITKALEEAITCHANECFVASGIMVRKTLEELCHERDATGANLKERLRTLGTKIVLPKELLDGLDDLRLLGNDAAHIESQEFNLVGREEIEVGIEFAKEVLKAVFQYSDLLAKLRSLKRAP